jgi:hypothetical protein
MVGCRLDPLSLDPFFSYLGPIRVCTWWASSVYGNQCTVTRTARPFSASIVIAPASFSVAKARYLVLRPTPSLSNSPLGSVTVRQRSMRHRRYSNRASPWSCHADPPTTVPSRGSLQTLVLPEFAQRERPIHFRELPRARGFPPVIDPGLCIVRSGNPTFADWQITLVASPRNQRRGSSG